TVATSVQARGGGEHRFVVAATIRECPHVSRRRMPGENDRTARRSRAADVRLGLQGLSKTSEASHTDDDAGGVTQPLLVSSAQGSLRPFQCCRIFERNCRARSVFGAAKKSAVG